MSPGCFITGEMSELCSLCESTSDEHLLNVTPKGRESIVAASHERADGREGLQSAFPKVHFSEGSLFRRFIVPKVHSEIEVHCSEGSFIRNRGSLLRRFIIPKVQYSEISHLSDRKMLICYEMIRAFGPATFVHIQDKLGQEMVHEMNESDDTVIQTQDSHPGSLEVEHATSRSRRSPPIFSFTNVWRRNILL